MELYQPATTFQPPTETISAFRNCLFYVDTTTEQFDIGELKKTLLVAKDQSERERWTEWRRSFHYYAPLKYLQCLAVIVALPKRESEYNADWLNSTFGLEPYDNLVTGVQVYPKYYIMYSTVESKSPPRNVIWRLFNNWTMQLPDLFELQRVYVVHLVLQDQGSYILNQMFTLSNTEIDLRPVAHNSFYIDEIASTMVPVDCPNLNHCLDWDLKQPESLTGSKAIWSLDGQFIQWWELIVMEDGNHILQKPKSLRDPRLYLGEPVRARTAIADILLSWSNETTRAYNPIDSPFKLYLFRRQGHFDDDFVFITAEQVYDVNRASAFSVLVNQFSSLVWSLLAASILVISSIVAGNRNFRSSYVWAYLTAALACISVCLDQSFLNFVSSVVTVNKRRRFALVAMFMVFVGGIFWLKNLYTSEMQANYITNQQDYQTKLSNWTMYWDKKAFGVLTSSDCKTLEQFQPSNVFSEIGFCFAADQLTDLDFTSLVTSVKILYCPACKFDIFDFDADEMCSACLEEKLDEMNHGVDGSYEQNTMFSGFIQGFVCIDRLRTFLNVMYAPNQQSPSKLDEFARKFPLSEVREMTNLQEWAKSKAKDFAFIIRRRDFPHFWPIFEHAMVDLPVKFAWTPPNTATAETAARFLLVYGRHVERAFEAQWMIHRIEALFASGIIEHLDEWDSILFPPAANKSAVEDKFWTSVFQTKSISPYDDCCVAAASLLACGLLVATLIATFEIVLNAWILEFHPWLLKLVKSG